MHLGAITTVLVNWPLPEAAKKMHALGLQAIEIGTGGFFSKNHCHPAHLLADPRALEEFQAVLAESELKISAFAIHGGPLHPDPAIAEAYDRDFREAWRTSPENQGHPTDAAVRLAGGGPGG